MNNTKINDLRLVASAFLDEEAVRNEDIPMIVHHPFFNHFGIEGVAGADGIELVDVMASEENLKRVKNRFIDNFDSADEAYKFFLLVNKPYSLTFFKYTNDYLSDKDFSEMLRLSYQREEMPSKDIEVSIAEITDWFIQANPEYLMEEDERRTFDELPENIVVYRGVRDSETKVESLSWTVDIEVARRFQKMYAPKVVGKLYSAMISKTDTFAYWNEEKEILCHPDKLKNIKIITD